MGEGCEVMTPTERRGFVAALEGLHIWALERLVGAMKTENGLVGAEDLAGERGRIEAFGEIIKQIEEAKP